MHSTDMTRIARGADQNGWTVIAMAEAPAQVGTYPHGWAVLRRDLALAPGLNFLVSQFVLPTEGREDEDAFFGSSSYDLTRERAFEVFSQKVARDCAFSTEVVA